VLKSDKHLLVLIIKNKLVVSQHGRLSPRKTQKSKTMFVKAQKDMDLSLDTTYVKTLIMKILTVITWLDHAKSDFYITKSLDHVKELLDLELMHVVLD